MRIPCPNCGDRDMREFDYLGHETWLHRPAPDAPAAAWDVYLHNRANPAGPTRDLWYHALGCGAWVLVDRDTVTHDVHGARLAGEGA